MAQQTVSKKPMTKERLYEISSLVSRYNLNKVGGETPLSPLVAKAEGRLEEVVRAIFLLTGVWIPTTELEEWATRIDRDLPQDY